MHEIPLAERMRPRTLDDYLGQGHLVGEESVLRKSLEGGHLPSMILWGPPGVGKTTLAKILAAQTERPFHELSAIQSGVKEVREIIASVKRSGMFSGRAILFIDEIHRFSKSQQDSLLGAVEQGLITLIGATTENPSFEVIPALLSRSQVYVLQSFTEDQLKRIVNNAIALDSVLKEREISVREWGALLRSSSGDARRLLNAVELLVEMANPEQPVVIDDKAVRQALQSAPSRYDKNGESHYDIASALIKSIRGSDPNAAVYYLARMIAGGEDPKFIARRLIISATEDIGLANPTALVIANETFAAVERIGMPEGRIPLAQCVVYLASCAKSNASYEAINRAMQAVKEHGDLPVPLALRNAPTALMDELGYGKGYQYDHSEPAHFSGQELMPQGLEGIPFYTPGKNPREEAFRKDLREKWKDKYGY
ncbi:MAG: replication-associated recombination protein A [Flavobacteriales bacterium]|jgi:putative ATPase